MLMKSTMRPSLLLSLLVLQIPPVDGRDFEGTPAVAWSYKATGPIETAAALTQDHAFFATESKQIFALHRASGKLAWSFRARGECMASGVTGAGAFFAGCDDGILHAFEQATGNERWSHNAGGEFTGGAAFSARHGTVIVGSSKPSVLALDARTGEVKWKFTGRTLKTVSSTPVLDAEEAFVYVGDDGGRFYKLHADTGAVAWEKELEADNNEWNVRCAANVLDDVVLVSAGDPDHPPPYGSVFALSTVDGKERWRSDCAGGPNKCSSCWTTPEIVDGVVVLGCGIDGEPSGKAWGMQPATGKLLWQRDFPHDIQTSAPLALPDGKAFVTGCLDGNLYCLEAKTGEVRWKWGTKGGKGIWSTPRLAIDKRESTGAGEESTLDATIYVSSHDRHVYALRDTISSAASGGRSEL